MAIGEAAAAIDVATMHAAHRARIEHRRGQLGPPITEAEALRARRDMVYAQHQVQLGGRSLCEVDGARWVYDSDQLGAIRRDRDDDLTHHAASRQAAMGAWGKWALS